jgi:hypothetical protein
LKPSGAQRWLELIAAIITALVAVTAFAFTTFTTKAENDTMHIGVEKRLDRIEMKIDHLIERVK